MVTFLCSFLRGAHLATEGVDRFAACLPFPFLLREGLGRLRLLRASIFFASASNSASVAIRAILGAKRSNCSGRILLHTLIHDELLVRFHNSHCLVRIERLCDFAHLLWGDAFKKRLE